MFTRFGRLIQVALVTLAVLLAPLVPPPFSFWLALAAMLIAGIASLFLETAILAILNTIGVLLSPIVLSVAILAPTYLLALAAALRERFYTYADDRDMVQAEQPAWLPFCCGVALAAVLTGGVIHLLGI